MEPQDLLVGSVAGLLGLVLIVASVRGWTWYRQMRLTRALESRVGVTWTGRLTGLMGLLLIVVGIMIARGFSLVVWLGGN